jgi:hypothetical protein
MAPIGLAVTLPYTDSRAFASFAKSISVDEALDLRLGLGPLGWLIATPQNHPHPPLATARAYGQKLRSVFPGLGCAVRNLLPAEKGEYPPTGLSSGERVTTTRQALLLPLTMWRKMISGDAK